MRNRSTARAFYELLSSMRFAISLLTILGIASIIGTVLKQNEPYNNYLNQFGPFWFPVFEALDLYAVYNSAWFLVILAFLVLSTTTCIVRQTRPMLKDMRSFRENAREASLAQFAHHDRITTTLPPADARAPLSAYLSRAGFALRINERSDGLLLAARQGSWTRWGYFLAHGAIVLICVGGLLDGNLPLRIQMALGGKQVTSGNQLISEIGPESRLGVDNWSYRGNVFIPEGKSANVGILNVKDGILLQDLPFTVSLKKFHLDHYESGMPKRFASDIIITDNATGQSVEKTIEVNKPFEYAGIMMYQASFEDGGSRLKLTGHDLRPASQASPFETGGAVGDSLKISTRGLEYTLELVSFKPFNIENMASNEAPAETGTLALLQKNLGSGAKSPTRKDMQNVGPSIQYKLRDAAGQAREYQNYMLPIQQDGAWYLLSGMRAEPSAPFRFMRIPMDMDGRPDSWFAIRQVLLDPTKHEEIARRFTAAALGADAGPETRSRLQETTARSLELFAQGGFESLGRFIESSVPEGERDKAADVFIKILEGTAWEAWKMARAASGQPAPEATGGNGRLLRDTLNATSDSLHYGAPLYFQLKAFEEVRATVLQVTRSPGKPIVYLGSLLLVLGVFAMLYVRERRLFVLIKDSGEALVALSSNRKSMDVDESFRQHRDAIATLLAPSVSK
ncbi:cytochrome c biogenesis protein ResB [Zoogloea sp.]|uniref:cytochrome c biogenesis protein ResB n=1 Tax=Zoogloea sp. TaxID=49181 RepID=UPI0026369B35|nr:cytochrome c biogenesis protein ResB [Zoogloea sp.]MDD3352730.1 cytochrome c biogenesis protein ResB [Zoogloea sp.]